MTSRRTLYNRHTTAADEPTRDDFELHELLSEARNAVEHSQQVRKESAELCDEARALRDELRELGERLREDTHD